jgi:outer membrane lipoprotein-sorting protein
MRVVFALFVASITAISSVAAQSSPDAKTLVKQMKDAVEPAHPSLRKVVVSVTEAGQRIQLVGQVARKVLADGKRQVIIMTEPRDIRGTALLIAESQDLSKLPVIWLYSPVIRRVRKLAPVDVYDHFLDTDFTYADLGYVRVHDHYTLLGETEVGGTKAYKIEEKIPQDEWYYSRVVTYIAADTKLPVQRDYYDAAGALWKTEALDHLTNIDGIPTVLHAVMKDVQAQTSTELAVSEVRYDVDVPDAVFDPLKLGLVADHPVWQAKKRNTQPGK